MAARTWITGCDGGGADRRAPSPQKYGLQKIAQLAACAGCYLDCYSNVGRAVGV